MQPAIGTAAAQLHFSPEPAAGGADAGSSPPAGNRQTAAVEPASLPPAPETAGDPAAPEQENWLLGLALLAITLLAYLPALRGAFLWDDDTHIYANKTLRSLNGLWQIWFKSGATCQYYPLTFTVFWLEYHLWTLHTLGYHLVNVLLHGTAAVLFWQVLQHLQVRGAWLAGAIFALHPVCVMSVAWMTELKNVLSASLALGAGWAYLRAAGLGVYGREGGEPRLGLALLRVVARAISTGAVRENGGEFPAGDAVAGGVVVRSPDELADGVAGAAHVGHGGGHGAADDSRRAVVYGGASGEKFRNFNLSFADRVLISGRSFWFYLGKLFFPHRLRSSMSVGR